MPTTLPLARIISCLVLLAVVLLAPPLLQAAALGPLSVHSALGQILDAEVDITALLPHEAEGLTATLAPAQAFTEAGVDYSGVVRSLRFVIEQKNERSFVHITSTEAIHDPFISILLSLNGSGNRIIRQYALLLDPPVLKPEPKPVINDAAPAPSVLQAAAPVSLPVVRTVKPGDTLGKIASHIRPAGTQIESVMLALQNANPEAFIAHNINRIKTGSVLTLPDEASIRAINDGQARKSVQLQSADYQRYRQSLAQQAEASTVTMPVVAQAAKVKPEEPPSAIHSQSGKTSAAQAAPDPGSPAEDKLHLSAAIAANAAPVNTDTAASVASSLDKIASDKALAEANARIAALEKNMQDIEQVMALKNKSLAELQARASLPQKPAAAKALAPDLRPDSVTQWVQQVTDEPQMLAAVAAILIVLLACAMLRRRARRRRASGENSFSVSVAHAHTAVPQAQPVEPSNSVFHSNFVPSVSQLDTNEVDALAEADIYIAYGRDEQAEEILLDALRTYPRRHALRVKLLELYAARKDKHKFGHLAADLHSLTSGLGEEWQQAAQMGHLLDPGNLLYLPPLQAGVANDNLMPFDEEKNTGLAPVPNLMEFDLPSAPLLTLPKAAEDGLSQANETALQTKLELAQACQEIGDWDGARELLVEVAAAPHPALAGKAKSLLGQLA
ncbi:MAG: FimV/HubP family polar landmark protein [Burkholderiaceae bacterium]